MSDELITADTISVDLLKSVYDAAMMDTRVDEHGQLLVSDGDNFWGYVLPFKETARIQLLTVYSIGEDPYRLLDFVNDMNIQYIMTRATIREKNLLYFDHDISVQGGVVPKTLVLTTKRFLSIPPQAVRGELPKYRIERKEEKPSDWPINFPPRD